MTINQHNNAKRKIISLASFVFLVVISLTLISAVPYLEGKKVVSPNVFYVGDSANITLTVTGSVNMENIRVPMDVMLVIDNSCSIGSCASKIADAISSANAFIDGLNSSIDRVGFISFDSNPTIRNSLTNNLNSVKSNINLLSLCGNTNIGAAIKNASGQFGVSINAKVIILISDGRANLPANARAYALEQARLAAARNISIYTIGIGEEFNAVGFNLLKNISIIGKGVYWHYPTVSDPHTMRDIARWMVNSVNDKIILTLAGRNVVITDVLAKGVDLIGSSLPVECIPSAGNKVICDAGSLNIGESKTFSFKVFIRNSSLTHLNKIAYVNYTNYQNNPISFLLNNPNVTVFRNTTCINCNNTNDTIPPIVTLVSPNSSIYSTGLILLNISAVDVAIDDIWYQLNGVNYSYYLRNITLLEGYHTIIAYANDSSGNIGYDDVSFRVNYTINGNQTNPTNNTNSTHVHNASCANTHAPVNDLDINETIDSISMNDDFVVALNYVNKTKDTSFSLESYLSGEANQLIFNMILLIAIIVLLLIIVLIGRK